MILEFDGEAIEDTRELVRVVADTDVGRKVDVVVFRDGKEQTLNVAIGRLEEPVLASAPGAPQDDKPMAQEETVVLGMTLATVDEALRQQFGLDADVDGLVVTGIEEGSDAFVKGMREGDLITEVGREPVATPHDMRDQIEAAEEAGRNSLLLLVRRDGTPRFVALSLSS